MASKRQRTFWSALSQPKWIFWLIRGVIFLSFAFWFLFSTGYDQRMCLLLVIFLAYSLVASVWARKAKADGVKSHFLTSFLDIVFIALLGLMTGGKESGFFFLYFLVVPFGSYVAGLAPGFALAFISSMFYFSLHVGSLGSVSISSVLVKTLALWALAITVGVVVKEMKSSRSKLLSMFDVLNQRTSELEKSQAQIESIYETSRSLGERLDLDEVVGEILRIVQKIMHYQFFSIFLLTDQRMLSLLGQIKEGKTAAAARQSQEPLSGLFSLVVAGGKPVRVFEVHKEPDLGAGLGETRSLMAVPLISRKNVIGLMEARSIKTGAFLDQDEKVFSILAGSAALAIENALLHQKTQELTIVDDLTGLYNYRYFTRKLETEIMRAQRYHQPLSLIMIDIDWFKKCNDTHGHLFGNLVLKDLAERTKESVREVDVVCRYGGEEFVVILPQTNNTDARIIGERIRCSAESADFVGESNDAKAKITVSLGIASFPENGRTSKELIEKVDQALYLAKGRGKNLVCAV